MKKSKKYKINKRTNKLVMTDETSEGIWSEEGKRLGIKALRNFLILIFIIPSLICSFAPIEHRLVLMILYFVNLSLIGHMTYKGPDTRPPDF